MISGVYAGLISSVTGIPIDKVALLDQKTRNYIGKKLLELTLNELFVYRFMQACSFLLFHVIKFL